MTLPQFSGTYVRCVKCGLHSEATVQWRPAIAPFLRNGTETCPGEHLQRTCRYCSYSWAEAIAELCA